MAGKEAGEDGSADADADEIERGNGVAETIAPAVVCHFSGHRRLAPPPPSASQGFAASPVVAEPRRFLRGHRSAKPKAVHPFSAGIRRKVAATILPISSPAAVFIARHRVSAGKDRADLLFALVSSVSTVVPLFAVVVAIQCSPAPCRRGCPCGVHVSATHPSYGTLCELSLWWIKLPPVSMTGLVFVVSKQRLFGGEVPEDVLKTLVCKASHTDPKQPFEHVEPV
uniref:Uncharacterized protein n=1 Tax=Oryza sativa subsp. japonica TaxID=39947 RepID=Q6ZJ87_ORYSJ|nr:hypothetical protein [Oryza sativa Japonica Group]